MRTRPESMYARYATTVAFGIANRMKFIQKLNLYKIYKKIKMCILKSWCRDTSSHGSTMRNDVDSTQFTYSLFPAMRRDASQYISYPIYLRTTLSSIPSTDLAAVFNVFLFDIKYDVWIFVQIRTIYCTVIGVAGTFCVLHFIVMVG